MKKTVKWQRLRYMPMIPLGEDGRRATASKAHIDLSREAACEGMVLLKNENNLLPLAAGTKLAVFGKAQADYVKGGGGSSSTTCARCWLPMISLAPLSRSCAPSRWARQPATTTSACGLRRRTRRTSCMLFLSPVPVTVQVLTTYTSAGALPCTTV